jgi:hypothetical protein
MDRRRRPARHSLPIALLGGRSTWIAAALVVVVFLVIALGSNGPTEEGATEQDLLATVQGSMVQAGLPTVKVRVVDWTVILEGRVATSELKEAAERVAFAQANVISVQTDSTYRRRSWIRSPRQRPPTCPPPWPTSYSSPA